MKFIAAIITLLLLSINIMAQVQYEWAVKTNGWPYNSMNSSLTVDNAGNIYVVGDFMGTMDFDLGSSTDQFTSMGSTDVFVSKYDPSGNYLWTKTFGGTQNDDLFNITSDGVGNIYCLGRTSGSVNFNPSGSLGQINSSGSYDIFVLKLDLNGDFQWVKKTGGNQYDYPNAITYKNGFVYYCGYFESTVDFDPGSGNTSLTAIDRDGFISKLDAQGNFIWVKGIQGNMDATCNTISLDAFDNLYVGGAFRGTYDFNPGLGIFNMTDPVANAEGFILKLDASGNFVWAQQTHTNYVAGVHCVETDLNNDITLAVYFQGSFDFNSTNPALPISCPTNVQDFGIIKMNPAGNILWVKQLDGPILITVREIETDSLNNIFINGAFQQNANLDFGETNFTLSNPNGNVISSFTAKYNASGNFKWGFAQTDASFSGGFGMDLDYSGDLFCSGKFLSNLGLTDINGTQILNGTSGNDNAFIVKIDDCDALGSNLNASVCSSYISPSQNFEWTSSGIYIDVISNSIGCDSAITINLTIKPNGFNSIDTARCDSYLSPAGQLITETGTYYDTIPNPPNCDSVIEINFTQLYNLVSIDTSSCTSYFSPGGQVINQTGTYYDTIINPSDCDSIIEINFSLIYNYGSIDTSTCGTYLSPGGQNLSSNGIYYDTISNPPNCDSILEINLTINSMNTGVNVSGITLQSLMNNATYQWLDCGKNMAVITGATGQTYTPTVNGSYAVLINNNGCTDTSACFTINTIGISESSDPHLLIYPNPSNGYFTISGIENIHMGWLRIFDAHGKIVVENSITESGDIIIRQKLAAGIYWIEVVSDELSVWEKLVIQK